MVVYTILRMIWCGNLCMCSCRVFIHYLIHAFVHDFFGVLCMCFIHDFMYEFIHGVAHAFMHELLQDLIHEFMHDFVSDFVCSCCVREGGREDAGGWGENREAGVPRKNLRAEKKKRRGKREEERTPEAASQVVQLAAGETLRSNPCGAATSQVPPNHL